VDVFVLERRKRREKVIRGDGIGAHIKDEVPEN